MWQCGVAHSVSGRGADTPVCSVETLLDAFRSFTGSWRWGGFCKVAEVESSKGYDRKRRSCLAALNRGNRAGHLSSLKHRGTSVDRQFSALEKSILSAKGLTAEQIDALNTAGVASRDDLKTVGDAETLRELAAGIPPEIAMKVMDWAVGRISVPLAASGAAPQSVILDTADIVHCVYCSARQPKDYKSGDLCIACGKQAEPVLACFWCSASGPGKFCRSCGAEFLPTAELDLGILLRHEGLPKDEIPRRLKSLTAEEKDLLWGRVRKMRH